MALERQPPPLALPPQLHAFNWPRRRLRWRFMSAVICGLCAVRSLFVVTTRGLFISSSSRPTIRSALQDSSATAARSISRLSRRGLKVDNGMKIMVDVTMRRDDTGDIVEQGPLSFICGTARVMKGLEDGVKGMMEGDTKQIRIDPSRGFGFRDDARFAEVEKAKLPKNVKIGDQVVMHRYRRHEGLTRKRENENTKPHNAIVMRLDEDKAIVDFNHPLAGRYLTVDVVVRSVELERLLPDALQRNVEQAGDGQTFPKDGDMVTVHYTGILAATNKQFDSSRDRNKPFEFKMGAKQVIEGWEQGVREMSLGERSFLRIPAAKAYGSRGVGDVIPRNADLVFDVELLDIKENPMDKFVYER